MNETALAQSNIKKSRRTYGTIKYLHDEWVIDAEPQVMMILRRIFEGLSRFGHARISHTPSNCRDLEWFLSRYPLDVSHPELLFGMADQHRKKIFHLESILAGDYESQVFDLAIPLRHYQQQAVDLYLANNGLLCADDLGLGKSAIGIASFLEQSTMPAVVIALTHLTYQWQDEIHKFAPDLFTHVVKKGTPYKLPTHFGRQPDVLIMNYHKVAGWCDELVKWAKSIVFDECQELRREHSQKYSASKAIAMSCDYRIGLSVGPASIIELRGGPFGNGWIGSIDAAWESLGGYTVRIDNEYELIAPLNVESRGWEEGFCWKPVKHFIRHACNRDVRKVSFGGRSLVVTDDHSLFVANAEGLRWQRSDMLKAGDIVPADNGTMWTSHTFPEESLDTISIASNINQAQVVVDLTGHTRQEFGLKAWEWQNCHREATYGTRLPLHVFQQHKDKFESFGPVYIGRGKACSAPVRILLSDWAYILGFFIGDGWVSSEQRVCFAVENARIEDFIERLKALPLGLRPYIRKMPGASVEVRCTHKIFAMIMIHLFKGALCYEKRIPSEWITTWSRNARENLLQGLLDSDGHVARGARNRNRGHFTTTSQKLSDDVLALLRSLGVMAGIIERPIGTGGIINGRQIQGRRPSFQLNWSMAALDGPSRTKYGHRCSIEWGFGKFNEAKVSSWCRVPKPEWVYDLEMKGHPSFVTNGLLVHNSATPIYNYGDEMFNVLDVLTPGALGRRHEFLSEWCTSWGTKYRVKDPAALGAFLRENFLMLRRTRADVQMELPPIIRIPHSIDSDTRELHRASSGARELASIILRRTESTKEERFVAGGQFDMIMRQATGLAKAPFVADFVRMLLDSEKQVILAGWHREVYKIWEEKLKDLGIAYYTGTENAKQKKINKQRFLDGDARILFMSLRSGAGLEGLQTACNVIVFGELDWSYGVHEQCIGRIRRDGMSGPPTAYYLISDDGADPIMADVLGVKREQLVGINDPDAPLIEKLDRGGAHVKELAIRFLERTKGVKCLNS